MRKIGLKRILSFLACGLLSLTTAFAAGCQGADGKDGKNGENGKDGTKVTIGENGNWFLDGVDTGLKAGCDCVDNGCDCNQGTGGNQGGTGGGEQGGNQGGETPVQPTEFTPIVRFVVTSDVHLREYNSMNSKDQLAKVFDTAYDYVDEQTDYTNLDGMFFVGDNVNYGTAGEYTDFFKYVKENTRSSTVSRAVMGNHEYSVTVRPGGWNKDTTIPAAIDLFKEASGYASEDTHIELNDFHFIFLSMDRYGSSTGTNYEFLSGATEAEVGKLDWLKQELDNALADDSTGKKPIFVFQHVHPQNTVEGSSGGDKYLRELLNDYPNVVDFSGHTHRPVSDPRSVWQDEFTAINTGSMAYLAHPVAGHPDYDTSAVTAFDDQGEWYKADEEHAARDGGLYYICEVDANNVLRITVYDTFTDSVFGEPMYFDSFGDPTGFDYTANRKADSKKPSFAADTQVSIATDKPTKTTLLFPQAGGEELVQNYRVEVYQNGTLVKTEYRLSGCHYGNAMKETMKVVLAGLAPATTYTAKIYAVTYWGKESKPIEKQFTTAAAPTVVAPDIASFAFGEAAVTETLGNTTLTTDCSPNLIMDTDLNQYVGSFTKGAYVWWGLRDWYTTMKETFSVEVYAKVTETSTSTMYLVASSEHGGFNVTYTKDGEYAFGYTTNVDTYSAKKAGGIGEWVHLVGVFEKTTVKLYINGELAATAAASGTYKAPSLTAQFFAIGSDTNTENRTEGWCKARIAACNLYSYSLTDAQVATLYSGF